MNYIMTILGIIALVIGYLVRGDYNKTGFYGMSVGFEISALISSIGKFL